MAIASTAPYRPAPTTAADTGDSRRRRISPEISEVLHLLVTMERRIEDAGERQPADNRQQA